MQQASQLEIYLSSFFRIYDNKIGNLYVVDQGKIYRSAEALSMIIHKIDFYLSGETDWDSILSDVPNENNPFNFTRCLNYIRSVKMMLEPINLNIFDTNSKYIFSLIAREYMHQDLIGVILKLSDAEITKKFQDTEHNNSLVQIAKLRGILFIIK